MIKGLILDVDGVIVGGKKGYNWPNPHPDVIQTLKTLRQKGIIVSLCTGKGTFAIKEIVKVAHLDNVHIGDGGAIVIDVLNDKIIDQHIIKKEKVQEIIKLLQSEETYVELYTKDGYYIQKDYVCDKTSKHADILYRKPNITTSLIDVSDTIDVIKIMPVANDETDKKRIIELFQKHRINLDLQWGIHLTALPYQFGIITIKGISKKQAAMVIAKHAGISLDDMLGVGDGMTDWQFMDICGYAGVMGNGSKELKDKVSSKGNRGYVGGSVDENGLIDILKHFNIM